jgi:hypothetical protein
LPSYLPINKEVGRAVDRRLPTIRTEVPGKFVASRNFSLKSSFRTFTKSLPYLGSFYHENLFDSPGIAGVGINVV